MDMEDALKNIDFTRMSKVKEKLLAELINRRLRKRFHCSEELDMDDLDQVVAAKGEEWRPGNGR